MKTLASLVFLSAIAGNAAAATLVQSKVCAYAGNGGGNTTTVCSLDTAATIGNRIIAVVNNSTLRSVVSGADSGSTSYAQAGSASASQPSIWHGPVTSSSAGSNVVFTLSGNSGDPTQVVLFEVSGLASDQSALTQVITATGPGTTHTSSNITPANATGFAVAVSLRGNRSYTEDPDWTQMSTGAAGSYVGHIVNAPAASLNISFTADSSAFATTHIAAFVGADTLYYGYTPTLYMAPADQGMGDCSSEANACDPAQAVTAADCGDIVGALPGTYSFTPPGSNDNRVPMLSFTDSCTSGSPLIFTAKYDALHNESNSSLLAKLRSSAPDTSILNNNAPVFGILTDYVKAIGFYVDQSLAPPRPSHGTVYLLGCTGCEIQGWVFDQMNFSDDGDNYNSIYVSLTHDVLIKDNVFRGGTSQDNNHNVCAVATYASLDFTIANNSFSSVNCGIFIKGSGSEGTVGNRGIIERNKSMNASLTFVDIAVVRASAEAAGNRVVVRENLSVNDSVPGERAFGCDDDGEGCRYVDIYHNTAVNNAAVRLFWMRSPSMTDMTFRDNVGVFTSTVGSSGRPIDIQAVGATAFTTLDYNFYSEQGATALYAMLGSTYSGIAAWQTATGKETHSTEATPTFVDSGAGDYRLSGDTGSSTAGARGITTAPADLGAPGT